MSVLAAALWTGPSATAQVAGLGVAITPGFQNPVTVGQQDQPARLQLVNSSFGLQAGLEAVTVTNIRLNPGCATSAVNGAPADPSPCPQPEPRANASQPILDIAGTSTAATTCPGHPFTITGPDAEGDYAFAPSGPVTLAGVGQAGSTCDIYFTFDVIQRPTDGATFQAAALVATSPSFPGGVPQTGVSGTTVNQPVAPTTTTVAPTTTTTVAGAVLPTATSIPPAAQAGTTVPRTMASTGGTDAIVPGLALLVVGLLGLSLARAVAHPPGALSQRA